MIKNYLTEKKFLIITFFMSNFIFALILSLYKIQLEIIFYPLVVTVIINLFYLYIDYKKYVKNFYELSFLLNNLEYFDYKENEYNSILKNKYFEIINVLKEENKKIISKSKEEQEKIQDYYTQWVHQIKTPISALNFLIENEKYESKEQLEKEVFRIEQYVNMVLTYLRLDSEYNDLKIEKVNIDKIVKDIIKKYSTFFISKKIKLKIEIQENTSIVTDSKWLSFAVEQIINNSVKYVEKYGEISITFENNQLIIEDNGIGIAKEDIPILFEKGYTGFNGRKNKKSSGIGLYLTKRTLDKLGYKIKVSSKQNIGTVTTIYFK